MIKEKELPKAVVNNKLITHKATDLTIMSYDKNVHKLIIPTDLTQDQINDIIVLITFRYHENIIQISGELVEDKIEIILPNEIRSLSGEFYIEIDINLTDNRQITFARYRANVVKSDIDSVDLDDAQEFYFELFDDFVQKVADNSEVAVSEIDAHKQSVSDKADTAIAVITDASNSVTTAKQSALTSITQATSDFTADLADIQSTIDAQVAQAQDSLQEVSDTLTAVNDKVTTVNDTADSFMADVADKSQLVDDKYQQFDDNVTQAGQTIDDILALQPQLVEKVQNFKLKNEIVNGDFSQGMSGWTLESNFEISNGKLIFTTVQGGSVGRNAIPENARIISGNIYYLAFNQTILSGTYGYVRRALNGLEAIKGDATNGRIVLRTTANVNADFYLRVSEGGDSCEFDNFILIDLTETFGAGNEPEKEEMDRLVEMIPNQWWDGELDLTQQQYVNWLLSFIREKANKTQEEWITPTLLNGWTQYQAVGYYKDSLSVVHLKGTIVSGTIGQDAFVLPVGYRPSNNYNNFSVKSSTVVGSLSIRGASLGTVRPLTGSTSEFCLDGVTFRTEA